MKTIFIVLAAVICVAFSDPKNNFKIAYSSSTPEDSTKIDNWKTIKFLNLGEISYPSNRLEIQNANLKALNDSIISTFVIPVLPSKLTLQQVGLNSGQNFNYCRVLIEEIKGNQGDFLMKNTKLNTLSNDEKSSIKAFYKKSIVESFKSVGIEIKKWYPVLLTEINGSFCIILKYERESTVSKSDVLVNLYCFPNNNREIDLTLSCRIAESISWDADFVKIVNSFKLR